MNFLFPRPKRKQNREENSITNIGAPTNVNRVIHVTVDDKGILKGLPSSWMNQIGTQITKDEQIENPLVVKQVLQYYNYQIKKGNVVIKDFKHIVTEEDLEEESKQIDHYLQSKDAHKSKDSNLSDDSSTSEESNR